MDLDPLIPDAQGFLRSLSGDNSKTFWQANKAVYDAKLKAPAMALLDEIAPRLAEMTGDKIAPKLFRPQRDIRFSADKRPYKDHLHMIWHVEAGGRQDPGYFFGIGTDYVTVGAGIMGFDKPVLDDWRKFLDLDTDRIAPMLDGLQKAGWGFWEPELKRVPAGYAADHPLEYFLRMKGAVATSQLGDGTAPLPDRILTAFARIKPFADLVTSVACA